MGAPLPALPSSPGGPFLLCRSLLSRPLLLLHLKCQLREEGESQAGRERWSGGGGVRGSHSILMRISFDSFENSKVGEGGCGNERAGRGDCPWFWDWVHA